MTETRELRSVMNEAEQAANAGDYAAAEPLLREAALLQEAGLGPLHPDLANTLNNLAVVCELTGKLADAEQFYRRGYAIATAVLAPGDELRATSERNLRDFCKAHGRPLPLPTQAPAAPEREPPVASVPIARPTPPVSRPPVLAEPSAVSPPPTLSPPPFVEPVSSSNSARPLQLGMLGAAALLVTFLAAYFWVRADAPESVATVSPTPAVQATPAPPQPSAPVTPAAAAPAPAPPAAPATSSSATAPPKTPAPRTAPIVGAPAVVEAQLCRRLSRGGTWRCDPVNTPTDPGRLFFYTRLKTASGTTVHHRWYRGDRLIQAVELKIQPNAQGYRTYSQNTVNAQSGDWRVELAAANGDVLQEVRFAVK